MKKELRLDGVSEGSTIDALEVNLEVAAYSESVLYME